MGIGTWDLSALAAQNSAMGLKALSSDLNTFSSARSPKALYSVLPPPLCSGLHMASGSTIVPALVWWAHHVPRQPHEAELCPSAPGLLVSPLGRAEGLARCPSSGV